MAVEKNLLEGIENEAQFKRRRMCARMDASSTSEKDAFFQNNTDANAFSLIDAGVPGMLLPTININFSACVRTVGFSPKYAGLAAAGLKNGDINLVDLVRQIPFFKVPTDISTQKCHTNVRNGPCERSFASKEGNRHVAAIQRSPAADSGFGASSAVRSPTNRPYLSREDSHKPSSSTALAPNDDAVSTFTFAGAEKCVNISRNGTTAFCRASDVIPLTKAYGNATTRASSWKNSFKHPFYSISPSTRPFSITSAPSVGKPLNSGNGELSFHPYNDASLISSPLSPIKLHWHPYFSSSIGVSRENGYIHLLDTRLQRVHTRWKAHEGICSDFHFLKGHRFTHTCISSGHHDGYVYFWDTRKVGEALHAYHFKNGVSTLSISHDSAVFCVATINGEVQIMSSPLLPPFVHIGHRPTPHSLDRYSYAEFSRNGRCLLLAGVEETSKGMQEATGICSLPVCEVWDLQNPYNWSQMRNTASFWPYLRPVKSSTRRCFPHSSSEPVSHKTEPSGFSSIPHLSATGLDSSFSASTLATPLIDATTHVPSSPPSPMRSVRVKTAVTLAASADSPLSFPDPSAIPSISAGKAPPIDRTLRMDPEPLIHVHSLESLSSAKKVPLYTVDTSSPFHKTCWRAFPRVVAFHASNVMPSASTTGGSSRQWMEVASSSERAVCKPSVSILTAAISAENAEAAIKRSAMHFDTRLSVGSQQGDLGRCVEESRIQVYENTVNTVHSSSSLYALPMKTTLGTFYDSEDEGCETVGIDETAPWMALSSPISSLNRRHGNTDKPLRSVFTRDLTSSGVADTLTSTSSADFSPSIEPSRWASSDPMVSDTASVALPAIPVTASPLEGGIFNVEEEGTPSILDEHTLYTLYRAASYARDACKCEPTTDTSRLYQCCFLGDSVVGVGGPSHFRGALKLWDAMSGFMLSATITAESQDKIFHLVAHPLGGPFALSGGWDSRQEMGRLTLWTYTLIDQMKEFQLLDSL